MRRFLTLPDVAEALNISMSQTRALIKTGDLEGIQIGGRGQWRVEEAKLDEYIERQYAAQRASRATAAPSAQPASPAQDEAGSVRS
ncbi:helix-turn-helix domain-containing protein [Nesterenkonia sp. E16_7]|uniref:helix-turn-helix domain-containing protein n=1 Tax=unclassified Nesterenkonia TaxID=2629769 RepID=UPI001A9188EC|nr:MULTISPECIES: helix-turn-helix domain-containing protein [unclassified Nesterenkonia]MBO0594319.1 helix-turn-helix domain-containing protein [Nesterenkonia sp. E16_10]MBO0598471.1 helix-turn-helix domain-containing protein [Nesterenkonia sp. E16_7]